DLYGSAAEASTDATSSIADLACEVEAPSRTLAAAAEIAEYATEPGQQTSRNHGEVLAALHHAEAGPIERMLRDLEVVDRALLGRAAELDNASQNLVIEASERLGRDKLDQSAAEVTARFGAATLVKWRLGLTDCSKAAARPTFDPAVRPEP